MLSFEEAMNSLTSNKYFRQFIKKDEKIWCS